MKMKRYIYSIAVLALAAASFTSCSEDDQFKGELYKKVIYLLSDDDYSFSTVHQLGETSEGYVTVYCGGTEHVDKDVAVEVEYDGEGLANYNKLYFDIDESKFAKELDKSRYEIKSYQAVIKANSADNYALIPIDVNPDGLSPDSIYMIPLKIKNASNYEINEEKSHVLYRVLLKNAYATMESTTYYQMTGTETVRADGDASSAGVSVTRVVAPLSKNQLRMFVGTRTYVPSKVTKEELAENAMVVTVNDDNSISITPYKTLEVEQVGGSDDNYLSKNAKGAYVLNLRYRYKEADGSWTEMKETCVERKQ